MRGCSGSAAAFGGWTRTDLEGSSGEDSLSLNGVGRASWVRSSVASETASGWSSWCWAMSRTHRRRLSLPLKNRNSASGQYERVEASEKRRNETWVAPLRSHWMTAAEGGAGGLCMALLSPSVGSEGG